MMKIWNNLLEILINLNLEILDIDLEMLAMDFFQI